MKGKRVLFWTDLHAPFNHRDALPFLKAVAKKYKTDTIICGGDEVDHYALSDYDKDSDAMSAKEEYMAALKVLAAFYKAFPKALVCTSNHVDRAERKRKAAGIPGAYVKSWNEVLQAPKGWRWSDSWTVDDVVYEHGHRLRGGNTATYDLPMTNGKSTVFGHFHARASVLYTATKEVLIFGMNAGCLIDIHSYAMAYGSSCKHRPVIGCAVVVNGQPIFVPMVLDRRGRWTGKL